MGQGIELFPESASNFADRVDGLYVFLLSVAVFFTLLICVLVLYFGIRYRRGAHAERGHREAGPFAELVWAAIPLVLSMVMFFWGARVYYDMRQIPPGAMEISVLGKQWMWKIQHPGGKTEINELHLPIDQPVRLRMISEDVIHSFFIPAFRVKQDVLPGYYTQMWFQPTRTGKFHLFCAEYCGTEHSLMRGTVTVMDPDDYSRWLSAGTSEPLAVAGRRLFERFRCSNCHHPDAGGTGPSLVNVFGSAVPLASGGTVVATRQYLRDSILNPSKQIVAGHGTLMPSFEGQLDEAQVLTLIAYLETLSEEETRESLQ